MTLLGRLQDVRIWLFSLVVSLIALHLNWVWRVGSADQLGISLFLWAGVLYLLWQKRRSLNLKSGVAASATGLALIVLVLTRNLLVKVPDDILVQVSPLITGVGLGLIASGFHGLRQYWRELILVGVLVIPQVAIATLLEQVVGINELAARFGNFMLWYVGFEVARQGVHIILPTGVVEVNEACSGLEQMLILLRLAVLFVVLVPTSWVSKILVPMVAIGLAFIVNGARIGLLALLVSYSNQETFEYWHQGGGSQVFSLISMLLFGLFCWLLLQRSQAKDQNSATA